VAKLSLKMCVHVSDIDVERSLYGLIYNALSYSSSGKTGRSATCQGTGGSNKREILQGDWITAASRKPAAGTTERRELNYRMPTSDSEKCERIVLSCHRTI
jgi:hypothetical protein